MTLRPLLLLAWLGLQVVVPAHAVSPVAARSARADLPWLRWDERLHGAAATPAPPRGALLPATLVPGERLDPVISGEGAVGDNYGTSVAFDGDTLAVGIPDDIVVAAGLRDGLQSGSVYVYRRVAGDWTFEARLLPDDASGGALFGWHLALEGSRLVVGAPRNNDGTTPDTGAAYVFERIGSSWSQVARLRSPAALEQDRLGIAVALDGDTAVVGASGEDGAAGASTGSAHVFARIAGVWTWQTALQAPLPSAGDLLGTAVAIDAGVILAGTPRDEEAGGANDAGTVHVFTGSGANWSAAARLDVAGAGAGALVGSALALDGERAVVGAPGETVSTAVARGAVYVFPRAGASFAAPSTLVAPDGGPGDLLGSSVAVAGTTLLGGAPGHAQAEGAVYVYVDGGAGGGGFAFDTKLGLLDGPLSDRTGASVAMVGDVVVTGADIDDVPPNRSQGTVQVFVRNGVSWTREPQLDTGDGAGFELHGFGLALDRGTAVLGAFLDDTIAAQDDAGSADVFRNGAAGYARVQRLEASDGESEDRFGVSTALRGDTLLVGAYFNVIGGVLNRGSVYVLDRQAGSWTETANLTTAFGNEDDFFGFALALDGTRALIGAPGDDEAAFDAGAAYVFRREGAGWVREAKLLPIGGPESALAGIAVALAGDFAFVGAPESTVGEQGSQGRVYVYRRTGTAWALQQELVALDGIEGDRFGGALAASAGTLAIGASGVSSTDVDFHGAVYLFDGAGGSWTATPRVLPPLLEEGSGFGIAVALDRDRLLVGASGRDGGGNVDQGEAYLYGRNGTTVSLLQTLAPSTPAPFQFFGRSLALDYADILVGAPERAGDNPAEGSAYVFRDDERIFADGLED